MCTHHGPALGLDSGGLVKLGTRGHELCGEATVLKAGHGQVVKVVVRSGDG